MTGKAFVRQSWKDNMGQYCRTDIINQMIKKFEYKTYLEIGVRKAHQNHDQIICEDKEGVDPAPQSPIKHPVTSDVFFETNKKFYDVIFIDGDHRANQVDKDIINSLKFLKENGTILLHDCSPLKFEHQVEKYDPQACGIWNGSVWKSLVKVRATMDDVYVSVVDTDHGVGIIRRGSGQELFKNYSNIEEIYEFPFLEKNRKELLHLIPVDEFKRIYA